jgi:hypothetical protein
MSAFKGEAVERIRVCTTGLRGYSVCLFGIVASWFVVYHL